MLLLNLTSNIAGANLSDAVVSAANDSNQHLLYLGLCSPPGSILHVFGLQYWEPLDGPEEDRDDMTQGGGKGRELNREN